MKFLVVLSIAVVLIVSAQADANGYAFTTVLKPNWQNPGAFNTDFAHIPLPGADKIGNRFYNNKAYSIGGFNPDDRTVYAISDCDLAGNCNLYTFDADTYETKNKVVVSGITPIDLVYDRQTQSLIATGWIMANGQYKIISINPTTGAWTSLYDIVNTRGTYISRAAFDPDSRRFFFGTYVTLQKCALNVLDLNNNTTKVFTAPCSSGDVSNMQYNPVDKKIYFIDSIIEWSPIFSSIDPTNGVITPIMNMTEVTGGGYMNYFASFVVPEDNSYWAQIFVVQPYALFFVRIDLASYKMTRLPTWTEGMLFRTIYVPSGK